jgi:hypothetical protein
MPRYALPVGLNLRRIFTKAGRTPPTDDEFEDKMAECDELESKS